jgi:uncharacterized protein (TIGR02466 family)
MDALEAGQRQVRATGLFETTILKATMPDAQQINDQLRRTILARRDADPGVERSNVGGWQSAPDMLSAGWGGEAAVSVARFALGACNRYSTDVLMKDKPRFEWTADMWANVNRQGARNNTHAHPQAFWSAVYYVDDGYDGSADEALGGELVFQDPRYPMNRMFSTELVPLSPSGRPQHWINSVRPSSGMLIAFPSWLFHSVRAYHGSGTRISLAINMTVVPSRELRGQPGPGPAWR